MRKVCALTALILFTVTQCYAFNPGALTAVIARKNAGGGDYVPATIEFRQGGDYSGDNIKFSIYNHSDRSLVTNSVSSAVARVVSATTSTGTFTNCTSLVAGNEYHIACIADGTFPIYVSGNSYKVWNYSSTYDTFNDPLSTGAEQTQATFPFVIKNASGEILISYGDMATTTKVGYIGNKIYFKNDYEDVGAGDICNTL